MNKPESSLHFPFPVAPEPGKTIEIAPGILWARIPLPFRLNHVNIYLIDDGDGWTAIDTGLGDDLTRDVWEQLLAGPLHGRRLTRLIVTHYHPDHVGLAGWLTQRCDMPMLTSETSYLGCDNISLSPGALEADTYRDFYLRHGLNAETTRIVTTRGHSYLTMVTGLPPTFRRVVAGDTLKIGGRSFAVLTGDGHAPEQVMLYCAEEKIFLSADQVLAKISPNISVWAVEPEGNPLGLYLRSLRTLKDTLSEDSLVLPGHQLPFHRLHVRIDELIMHHEHRCATIAKACAAKPHSAADLMPVVFHHTLTPHEMSFAFSEVLAHINYMVERGELAWAEPQGHIRRVVTAR
jgi:glyoxylase-like metal-dependent hydrolase (beta-lactamase superfamily II)